MTEKSSVTLHGAVESIIKPQVPGEREKAQIAVTGAARLYAEIRIENTLTDENGEQFHLKPGARVEVTIEAKPQAIASTDGKPEN